MNAKEKEIDFGNKSLIKYSLEIQKVKFNDGISSNELF